MAVIFDLDFNDTDFPDVHGGGVAWDDGLDGTPASEGLTAKVGGFGITNENVSVGGNYSQILTAAGYRAGYKGFRAILGDGVNVGTANPGYDWDQVGGKSEFWFRWYMRCESGMDWTLDRPGFWKLLRTWENGHILDWGKPNAGTMGIVINESDDGPYGDVSEELTPAFSWATAMGGALGDGQWHCYEVHMKKNSATSQFDGECEFYFDGTYTAGRTDLNFDSTYLGNWVGYYVDNQSEIENGPFNVDYAEIKAVDSGGPIGPIQEGPDPDVIVTL